MKENQNNNYQFKAETKQLLNILIHSLYSNRDVFIRELISNASDALTRLRFEMLTHSNVLDPETELAIWLDVNEEERTITIKDSGIGMSEQELITNLGTIAQSGAKAFLEKMNESDSAAQEIIGQFGVGFYAAFMAAEKIRVESRSWVPDDSPATWESSGEDTFTISESDKSSRGTEIIIYLNEDAKEYASSDKLKQVIKKHSNYVPFPIYLREEDVYTQINQQTAIWRQSSSELDEKAYTDFYKQLTFDYKEPLLHNHIRIDAPYQLFGILYIPDLADNLFYSQDKDYGLALYARNILIQEKCSELLPEFLRFVRGVVDSEDLPLNVSRETFQTNRLIKQINKILTGKVFDLVTEIKNKDHEKFMQIWKGISNYLKQGFISSEEYQSKIMPLLHFQSIKNLEKEISLDDYLESMIDDQKNIYYLITDQIDSIDSNPHLDLFRKNNYDVLLLSDPLDTFLAIHLNEYKEHKIINVMTENLDLPQTEETSEETSKFEEENHSFLDFIKDVLKDQVVEVRTSDRLVTAPVRLTDKDDMGKPELQRAFRLLNNDQAPTAKILEINPKHAIINKLSSAYKTNPEMSSLMIQQLHENALLLEGIIPNTSKMVNRINSLMESMLESRD